MKINQKIYRAVYYILGLTILALGLTLNAKTGLGVSPITSLPYTVSEILQINFGNTVFVSYLVFIAIELVLKKQRSERVMIILQIPLSVVFTRVMNLFGSLFTLHPETLWQRILLLLCAILCTGVGAAMTMNMRLVPNPGDGIVQSIAEFSGREVGLVKNCVDLVNVLCAFFLGCLAGNPLLGVGLGTVIGVFGVGRIVALFNRLFKERLQIQSGLS